MKPRNVNTPLRGRVFDATFHFARQLAAGQVPGFENLRAPAEPQFGRFPRPADFVVNDRVVEAFREFIRRDPAHALTTAQVDAHADFVRLRLRED